MGMYRMSERQLLDHMSHVLFARLSPLLNACTWTSAHAQCAAELLEAFTSRCMPAIVYRSASGNKPSNSELLTHFVAAAGLGW